MRGCGRATGCSRFFLFVFPVAYDLWDVSSRVMSEEIDRGPNVVEEMKISSGGDRCPHGSYNDHSGQGKTVSDETRIMSRNVSHT